MRAPSGQLHRTVVWRNLFAAGSDYCSFWRTLEGWRLTGTAIAVLDGNIPLFSSYIVDCDSQWRTRWTDIETTTGSDARSLKLTRTHAGGWESEGNEFPDLAGCIDIDFALTPATNTLPIRRLNLSVGQSAQVTAAWVKVPGLKIEPLVQNYTRIAEECYLYQSATGFTAEITVDELGLVKSYPGGWERVI